MLERERSPTPVRLGAELNLHRDELVDRWLERWKKEIGAPTGLSEAAIEDRIPDQIAAIAEALERGNYRHTSPRQLWSEAEVLHPETRAEQQFPIEEIVAAYWLLVSTVRDWLNEADLSVRFDDLTFFYEAIFELVARSVCRYVELESERIERERSEYLAGLAHQMKGPLSVLTMNLGVLNAKGATPGSRVIETMARNVKRLSRQVTGFMRLERWRFHEIPVHAEEVQVAALLDEVIQDNEDDATKKGLGFHVRTNRAITLQADPDLLIDVLGNLVNNAVKYTDRGWVMVEVEETEDRVYFRVTDTGPGMDETRQAELFKPVQPGKRGGAGIGLSLAKRAVLAQGGEMGIDSMPSRGSRFWFWLPRAPSQRSM